MVLTLVPALKNQVEDCSSARAARAKMTEARMATSNGISNRPNGFSQDGIRAHVNDDRR
jgi:hypothetical protein